MSLKRQQCPSQLHARLFSLIIYWN